MGLITEIQKTEARQVGIGVGLFLATVAPGMLTIYLYQRSLLTELDTIPLLVFAAALGLPVLVVNFFVVGIGFFIAGEEATNEVSNESVWLLAMFGAFVAFYGALASSFEERDAFRGFLWKLVYFESLVILMAVAMGVGTRRDRKKKTENADKPS